METPMDKEAFLRKLNGISDLPTLPVVALKVNNMLKDYDVPIKLLSETIEKDQAMVSKILKLVNSAFYGLQSKINTISHAVTVLGFNTIRNAIVSVAVINAFSGKDIFEQFDITDFWKHSVATAVTGRHLAEKTRFAPPDQAFVAGILHDVGKVVLAQYFKELFAEVWTAMRQQGLSFCEAEKISLPTGHAQVGGGLAKKWQLPASLIEPIMYHHTGNNSAINPKLLMVIHASDCIANNYNNGLQHSLDRWGINPDAAKTMADQLETLPDWFPAVENEIKEACEFFVEDNRSQSNAQ